MASNLFALGLLLSILAAMLPTSILKSIGQTTKTTTPSPGICQLPHDSGPCMAYLQRWYFNHKTKKCQQFIYGGCNKNGNNFLSKAECLQACGVGSQLAIKLVTSAAPKVKEARKKVDNKTIQHNPPKQKPTVDTFILNKPCEVENRKALALNKSGVFVPECNHKGNYKAKQCWKPLGLPHRCWCVNHQGNKIGEVRINEHGKQTCKPLTKKLLPGDGLCSLLVNTYYKTYSQKLLSTMYIPQCDGSGQFIPLQCYQGNCWCADYYGSKIKGTIGKKGTVKCTHT